ncbi:TPA: hypothetical protein DEP94_02870 [Candidatus Nomurabacteria bacterium]|nr:hypothetical protein [Candidatus Nomurabacteria bacterium]
MANLKLKGCFISESVIISNDGKVSIINLFSEIKTQGFPVVFPQFSVLINISGDVGEYQEIVEIISLSDNKVMATTKGLVKIEGKGGNNFLANFRNIPFTKEETYWIKVTVNGSVVTDKNENTLVIKKVL